MINKKLLGIGIISLFIIFLLLPLINAEVSVTGNILLDGTGKTTIQYLSAKFDDTSFEEIGRQKPITAEIHSQFNYALPKNLTGSNQITDCNLTIQHIQHFYDTEGNLANTTITSYSYYFNNSNTPSGYFYAFDLVSRDELISDLVCNYNEYPDESVAEHLTDIASIRLVMPSWSCEECKRVDWSPFKLGGLLQTKQYDYREIILNYEEARRKVTESLTPFENITNVIRNNFEIWLILYWLFHIFALIFGAGLVFLAGFWVYILLKGIARSIK